MLIVLNSLFSPLLQTKVPSNVYHAHDINNHCAAAGNCCAALLCHACGRAASQLRGNIVHGVKLVVVYRRQAMETSDDDVHQTDTSTRQQHAFLEAVRTGDLTQLRRLLADLRPGVDVNGYNVDGQTALHQSCLSGNLDVVKLLVKFGADVRLANRDGWSALHIAAWKGHRDIALYLINANHSS